MRKQSKKSYKDNDSFYEDEQIYFVEDIVGKRIFKGRIQYLVKWKDYGLEDNTWEPVENLKEACGLVELYEMKLQNSLKNDKNKQKADIQINFQQEMDENNSNELKKQKEKFEENKNLNEKNLIEEKKANQPNLIIEEASQKIKNECFIDATDLIDLNTPDKNSKNNNNEFNISNLQKTEIEISNGKIVDLVQFNNYNTNTDCKTNFDKKINKAENFNGKKRYRKGKAASKALKNVQNENNIFNKIIANDCDNPIEKGYSDMILKEKKKKQKYIYEETFEKDDESFLLGKIKFEKKNYLINIF